MASASCALACAACTVLCRLCAVITVIPIYIRLMSLGLGPQLPPLGVDGPGLRALSFLPWALKE